VGDVVATFTFGKQVEDLSAESPELFGGPLGAITKKFLNLLKASSIGLRSGE
jgi:hypothetical protein